ncbi:MAG: XRE family transcriptional regulator [Pseudonocardiales bacterium]|nr:helix-turn-helix domain-containing protein [Pseudonocardiales bacterium]PZS27615.1 MAG: XRE family transcriptional regulator [Pseudonocardiales bacterium]
MRDREPTIRSRELGEGLHRAMRQAGLDQKAAAQKLGWSQSRVSRLLSGKRGGTEVDVSAFLAIVEVTGTERDRLLGICREQNIPGWLQQHGTRLPQQLRTLIDHENKAVTIDHFEATLVPGLLQTTDYARALIRQAGTTPAGEIEDRVAARLGRQSLFGRERPVRFTFFIHEFVLRLPVGGPAVMVEQLEHLLRRATRPYLTLRVVPAALGGHAAINGSFELMEFADFRPVAYLESETSSLFLEKPEEIAAYRRILGLLAETALSEGQSAELIATLATGLYADREDYDDRP